MVHPSIRRDPRCALQALHYLVLVLALLTFVNAPLVNAQSSDDDSPPDEATTLVGSPSESVSRLTGSFVMPLPANRLDTAQWYERHVYLGTARSVGPMCSTWSDKVVRIEHKQLRGQLPPGTSKQVAVTLGAVSDTMRTQLDFLKPPADLVSVHALYVEAAGEWSAGMNSAAAALMNDDENALVDAVAHFSVCSSLVGTADGFFT